MQKSFLTAMLAIGVAAASLTSCSRANYAFNPVAPSYLDSRHAHTVAVQPKPAAITVPLASVPVAAVVAPSLVASIPVPVIAVSEVAKPVKPSLVQRLALKSVVKQLNKFQRKQAIANVEQTAASKKGTSALVALAGLLLAILGLVVVGGSGLSGNGAGVIIGAILFYVGVIGFLVGLVLLVIHLVNGD